MVAGKIMVPRISLLGLSLGGILPAVWNILRCASSFAASSRD